MIYPRGTSSRTSESVIDGQVTALTTGYELVQVPLRNNYTAHKIDYDLLKQALFNYQCNSK
jgi:hypothetical protein